MKRETKGPGPDGIIRTPAAEAKLNLDFVALFGSPLGQEVLKHLRKVTIEQVCGPLVSNDALRHLEGQRFIVGIIEQRVRAGHKAKLKETPNVAAG